MASLCRWRGGIFTLVGALGFVLLSGLFCKPSVHPKDGIALGKMLFFDPILSGDRTISCATCHRPDFAFSDTSAISIGVMGRRGIRNTPSVMNVDLQPMFFWDGRAASLEEQALIPIANSLEMNLPVDSAVDRLRRSASYMAAFQEIYAGAPTAGNMALALAVFQRSLETNNTPFDAWRLQDNGKLISVSAQRGFTLFSGKANCIRCHFGANFNNPEFRNIGLYDGLRLTDSGRAGVTRKTVDLGKFKVPQLRNIALTAPYMHNGMFSTLREVIDYYNDPDKIVARPVNRDSLLSRPLHLTEGEKKDLEAFLRSLTDKRFN
jgi:cytochrome c peroxidase